MKSRWKEQWTGIGETAAEVVGLLCAATLVFSVLIVLGPLAQGIGTVATYM